MQLSISESVFVDLSQSVYIDHSVYTYRSITTRIIHM